MVKQRRSFFVDDILHMVMPKEKTSNYTNEPNDRKRKRSPENDSNEHEDESVEENSLNKRFRPFDHDDNEDDDHDESKHSRIIDVLGDDGSGDESSISDDSNSVGNTSGKLRYIFSFERLKSRALFAIKNPIVLNIFIYLR